MYFDDGFQYNMLKDLEDLKKTITELEFAMRVQDFNSANRNADSIFNLGLQIKCRTEYNYGYLNGKENKNKEEEN